MCVCGRGEDASGAPKAPKVHVPAGAAMVVVDNVPVSCGRMAEQIDNEAIDLEIMQHDLQENTARLVR